jgi:hypothetical protein
MMIKNGKQQNVVPTTAEQNMAAAKVCKTYNEAVKLFRALQHANNRGTSENHFNELEEHFIAKQGLMWYIQNGLTVAQASDKDAKDPEAYREYGVPTAKSNINYDKLTPYDRKRLEGKGCPPSP